MKDNRDYFLFGKSEPMLQCDAVAAAAGQLEAADFIVGHAIKGDAAWLDKIGVSMEGSVFVLVLG